MSIRERTGQAIRDALAVLPPGDAGAPARATLEAHLATLAEPLRVALAGQTSQGKSTLVNALAGMQVTATGRQPITCAVSVLRQADAESVTVRFVDHTERRYEGPRCFARAAEFTTRDGNGEPITPDVKEVEISGPFTGLGDMELADTPGYNSPHAADNTAAMAGIGADPGSVLAASTEALRSADAVVAVLVNGVGEADADVLSHFRDERGPLAVLPMTCLAVLNRVDELWPGDPGKPVADPVAAAGRSVRNLMKAPETRRLYRTVVPVCGLMASGAVSMTEADYRQFRMLADADAGTVDVHLRNHDSFGSTDDLPLPAEHRTALMDKFGRYGIHRAVALLREASPTLEELRTLLVESSGLNLLRSELEERFTAHSDLIKVARIVRAARRMIDEAQATTPARDCGPLVTALEIVTDLEVTELDFAEFRTLSEIHDGTLDVAPETMQALETAAGERGRSLAARLGRDPQTGVGELLRTARERLADWSSPLRERTPDERTVARVLRRRYAEIHEQIRQVHVLLSDPASIPGGVRGRGPAPGPETAPPAPADGREPVLVVDFGTTTSSAMLVSEAEKFFVTEEGVADPWWPTAVFAEGDTLVVGRKAERRGQQAPGRFRTEFKPDVGGTHPVLEGTTRRFDAEDLATAVLAAFRARAGATARHTPARLLVTVPVGTTGRRRDAMLSAGTRAGFTDVELLEEPVAAALAPMPGEQSWVPGQRVLVYDLGGGTFDAAVVSIGSRVHRVLGTAGLADGHGGRDVDAMIALRLGAISDARRRELSGGAPDDGLYEVLKKQVAKKIKEDFTDEEEASGSIGIDYDVLKLTRAELAEMTGPLLQRTVAICLELLARCGVETAALDGIMLAGGSTLLPVVEPYLREHLHPGGPIRRALQPTTAVVRGAVAWWSASGDFYAASAAPAARHSLSTPPADGREPLAWALPQGRATLVRWFVEPGDGFPEGATVARVRLPDNSLHDLRAAVGGRLERHHAGRGDSVYSGGWLATILRTAGLDDLLDAPRPLRRWPGARQAVALAPPGRTLAVARRSKDGGSELTFVDTVGSRDSGDGLAFREKITALSWSPDGATLAVGVLTDDPESADGGTEDDPPTVSVYVVEGARMQERTRLVATLPPGAGAVAALAHVGDGRRLAVLSLGGVFVVDTVNGARRPVDGAFPRRPRALALDARTRRAAVGGGDASDGAVSVFKLNGTAAPVVVRMPSRVHAVAFLAEEVLLVGGGTEGERGFLAAIDVAAGRNHELWRRPMPDAVVGLDVSPGTGFFAAVLAGRALLLNAVKDGTPVRTHSLGSTPHGVALSPDGHRLVTVDYDGVQLWSLTDSDIVYEADDAEEAEW